MITSRRSLLRHAALLAAWPLAARAGAATQAEGRAAAAPAIALPGLWNPQSDPAGYLVSEKYDGVRGVWDGRELRFRSGRSVPAPAWFAERLPKRPLDGELWLARGRFDALSGIVRSEVPDDAAWRELRYMVFDLPGAAGPFAQRARELGGVVAAAGWPQLVAAPQAIVADATALRRRLAETVAGGGEGLVLHRADAAWAAGRSEALCKFKPLQDAEATVVGHRPGRGKYEGQLGALEVRTPEGRRFHLGTGLSDELRRAPPQTGSVVTYRYRDVTPSGLPRFASFLRVHPGV